MKILDRLRGYIKRQFVENSPPQANADARARTDGEELMALVRRTVSAPEPMQSPTDKIEYAPKTPPEVPIHPAIELIKKSTTFYTTTYPSGLRDGRSIVYISFDFEYSPEEMEILNDFLSSQLKEGRYIDRAITPSPADIKYTETSISKDGRGILLANDSSAGRLVPNGTDSFSGKFRYKRAELGAEERAVDYISQKLQECGLKHEDRLLGSPDIIWNPQY
jgi:hypothetical protein